MRAHCLIRNELWYRREAFATGLSAAGHSVSFSAPTVFDADTLLVIWNRYWGYHDLAGKVEAEDGLVVVAENGYLGRGGTVPKWDVYPNGPTDDDYYALAIGGHNGSGITPDGDLDRWNALEIELKPWIASGGHILICPSRTFGRPGMIMAAEWAEETVRRCAGNREVRVRAHPGTNAPARPLQADLEVASACVIWASSAGVHALINGVPVFQCAPHWICEEAASKNLELINDPTMNSRLRCLAMQKLASAQWTVKEIRSGEPFARLLSESRASVLEQAPV